MQRILDILAEGRKRLSVPEATDWKALALTRWEMLRALTSFNAFKEANILDPIVASGDPLAVRRAEELKRENDALKALYDGFVQRWTLTSPLTVDETYLAEALRMAERIERQVIADVQALEALVRSTPTQSCPAAAAAAAVRPG